MSTSETVVTLARWAVNEQALAEVLGHLAELRSRSLAEPGCLGYEVFQSVGKPAALLLIERYRDTAALDAHRNSAHYQQLLVDRIRPRLEHREVEILGPRE